MTEHSITYDGSERRNGDRPLYCFEEHMHWERRIGNVEKSYEVLKTDFEWTKVQMARIESEMVTMGKRYAEVVTSMKDIQMDTRTTNLNLSALKELLEVKRSAVMTWFRDLAPLVAVGISLYAVLRK